MPLYQNKYRTASARARWWNYGWDAAYFVTICTRHRQHSFGNICNGWMHLSAIGQYANTCWHDIPNHFPFVALGAFVVMPNHVHGIVIINKTDNGNVEQPNVQTQNFASLQNIASLQNFAPPRAQRPSAEPNNQFRPQSQNLASIIRGYKIGVTKNARLTCPDFAWQPRFHDHIIRNKQSYTNISAYILRNPANWNKDTFYKRG